MRCNSLQISEVVVLRSMKYLSRNASTAWRATSTLSTSCLVLRTRAFRAASWACLAACCRARSSADPPKGCKAATAIARLASNSRPMAARIPTRGSFSPACRSKLLGIIHRDAPLVKRLRLGGGLRVVGIYVAEYRRFLERHGEIQQRLRLRGSHRNVQHHHVPRVDGGRQRDEFHVVGNRVLQVREQPAPTDSLVKEQAVDEHAVLHHGGVLGLAQDRLQPRLLAARRADLPVEPGQ